MQIDFKKSSLCYDKVNVIVKCPGGLLRPQAIGGGSGHQATISEVPGAGRVYIYRKVNEG